jgi:hypothetical protein
MRENPPIAAQKEPVHRHSMITTTLADVGSSGTSVSPSSSSRSMRGSIVPWSGCAASSRGRCSSSSSGDGGSTVILPLPVAIVLSRHYIECNGSGKESCWSLKKHEAYDTHATRIRRRYRLPIADSSW